MKKILVVILICGLVSSTALAGDFKLNIGFASLMAPDLSATESIPGASVTKGGLNFGLQYLFGEKKPVRFGIALEQATIYNYKYTQSGFGLTVSADASIIVMPILGTLNYDLGESETPFYLTAGLGMSMTATKMKITMTPAFFPPTDTTTAGTNMTIMLGLGKAIMVDGSPKLDVLVKYYSIQTSGEASTYVNLGVGIGF